MARYVKSPIEALETERLLLRPLQESDAPRIQVLFPNWNVLVHMTAAIPWPYPDDGAETFVRSVLPDMESGQKYFWAITLKDKPEDGLIGCIGLTPDSDEDNRGFWLGEPYWRQGYMSEAVAAVNDFAFERLQMEYMLLNNAELNAGSHKLKERSGAEVIAVDEADYIGGKLTQIRWKLTRDAWRAHREVFLRREPGTR